MDDHSTLYVSFNFRPTERDGICWCRELQDEMVGKRWAWTDIGKILGGPVLLCRMGRQSE